MTLSALIKKRQDRDLATAIHATPATQQAESGEGIAKIATIAVANNTERHATRAELIGLVRFCGEAYGFTEEEHAEALERALADFDSALMCFRAMKAEILEEGGAR